MSPTTCEWVRDRLPDRVAERLDGQERERLDAHLTDCPECREELALVRALRASRPEPSTALEQRVRSGLRSVPAVGARTTARPWWMAAAAVLVLALGTGVVWDQLNVGSSDPEAVLLADDLDSDLWPGGETMVAGGLVWEDLSDEELEALLEDFER